ncbi:coenzyme Q-binding protein COQ10 homolog, mitochondrial [Brienomyrus brachyistius]|uniref:coenzyme Q-binding protein COQ10 homolog, mitochondrial n=1 Tax=Brienomyrus brachyistius TaxID=42636 RepID=UPI0020B27484|nr:coenzyme Q-binding protein COQ10 homolog, mitochondrial [Brienomyrus brachyistius]
MVGLFHYPVNRQMAIRPASLLLPSLLTAAERQSYKVLKGNPNKSSIRHLASCGIPAVRQTGPHPAFPDAPPSVPARGFISLAAPLVARKVEYAESRALRYTPEQMYDVVACVDQYQQFVPWCKKSRVMTVCDGRMRAQLEIGFPPVVERYTSEVTLVPNHLIRAVCKDTSLFHHLETVWSFRPGTPKQPCPCRVDFYVSFEFKSLLHCQLSMVFFNEVVKQMICAFESQAFKLYGRHGPIQEVPVRSLCCENTAVPEMSPSS